MVAESPLGALPPVGPITPNVLTSASATVSPSNVSDSYLFDTNYILLVMKYTNIAMDHQANLVALQGKLEGVVTQIQGCLSTISEFFSTLESNAASGAAWETSINGTNTYSPNANSGLSYDFYHMSEDQGPSDPGYAIGSDSPIGDVSSSYSQAYEGFQAALKELFNSSSSGGGPLVSSIMSFDNPYASVSGQPGQFNMNSYYQYLANGPYAQFSKDAGCTPVSSNDTDHASLLQQYMYYQAQLTVNTDPEATVLAANGNIFDPNNIGNSLVDFDFTQSGCDPNIMAMMQILAGLDSTVTVSRQGTQDSSNYFVNNTTTNILSLVMNNNLYNQLEGSQPQPNVSFFNPGAYAAFSYLAFNYIWNKNPTMSVSSMQGSNDPNQPPNYAGNSWNPNTNTSGGDCVLGSTNNGDQLSDLYMNTNSAQTNLSSSGSQANSSFQEQVNGVQQMDNVAQNMISGWASAMTSVVGNWKSQ